MSDILIYETEDQQVEVRLERETVWLTQKQMSELLETSPDNISLHLKNIYADNELSEAATTEDFSVVRQEGARQVRRKLKHYNLDAIISVAYRVNSRRGTQFRIWATQRLRDYLVKGYAINRQRLEQNARELEQALKLVRKAARSPALDTDTGRGLVEIISRYTQTFLWLQRYDEGLLEEPAGHRGGVLPSPEEAMADLARLKQELMARGEATELFARPRDDGLAGIFGNLEQSICGDPAYPTI
ncbi:MAG TPA: hypothetical protein ENJ17_03030, partial [Gammaproteobacteria bacterium]|nr:hypothetical protein [Gammaproteobacteria bacterium]